MKQIIVYVLFFFVCSHLGNAQETTALTGDETIEYTVKTGDTKYSLANRFGIEIAELEHLNPQIVPMLKVGEVLQIHADKPRTESQDVKTYVVKSGDTKYGLSKKLSVSIKQLEQWNPHIVPKLLVGQTLSFSEKTSIPTEKVIDTSITSKDESQNDQLEQQTNKYVLYTVQSGETLYGLSKTAGMSIAAFLGLNPKLSNSVQAGMIIKMPSTNFSRINEIPITPSGNVKSTSNYTDLRQTLITEKRKNLTFFLPFSETEFTSELRSKNDLGDFLRNNRDFYSGALMAIDSAKSLGLNIDFDIVNTNTIEHLSEAVAKNEATIFSDAIISPYFENSLHAATEILDNIPVITVSSISENIENMSLFEAVPSPYAQRKTILDYLSSKNDGNLIVINDESKLESRTFIGEHTPEAEFITVKDNGALDTEALVKTLRKNSKNYIILDTEKNGVFISATNALLRELSNYQIQLVVLEASLIPDEDEVSRKRFVILDMLYPSISNVNSYSQKRFNEHYTKQFFSEPTTMSTYGFDITFDTLLRLFQPENFEIASKKIMEYNVLKFQYFKNDKGSHSNFGVHIFEYETHDNHKQVN